jgi:hypothetical protein
MNRRQCRSARQVLVGLMAMAILIARTSADEAPARATPNAPWFRPTLTINNQPICDAFLSGVKGHSSAYDGLKAVPPFFSGEDRSNSSVQNVSDHPELLAFAQRGAKPLYVHVIRIPGCGGACESEALGLYTALPTSGELEKPVASIPGAESWEIYEASSGRQFVSGIVEHQLDVYHPTQDGHWQLTCRVQLEPDLKRIQDARVQQAAASLHSLGLAAENMARGEGYGMCGTMHTAGRWASDFEHALNQVLFNPEATAPNASPSENSYGDYSRIYAALKEWSLGGIFEYRAFQQYNAQLRATTAVVKNLYQYGFHWSENGSLQMAQRSIQGAVSRLFGFYQYQPYPIPAEQELRQALLTHQPMNIVRASALALKAFDHSSSESILNVAIEYPEALSFLLTQEADPNRGNEFGKTPLMYAVQYNQLQAVRILLKAGADPNATTTVPPDNCSYAIQKHRVTALHYAVKYASKEVIQALLDAGAVTYIRTEHYIDPSAGAYPLEWLHESNSNLSPGDVNLLEDELQVPSDAERAKLSVTLTTKAEASNLAGKTVDAYRTIRLARLADPANARATADFPLLALKAGAVGPALEGSAQALATAKTPVDRAAALFNQGLACVQATPRHSSYNNVSYCGSGYIDPFLQSWRLEPTSPRANKLVELLGASDPTNCAVVSPGSGTAAYRFFAIVDGHVPSGQLERIYALHPPSVAIDPSAIQWQIHTAPPAIAKPHLLETLTLDKDHALTVLEGEYFPTSVTVDGKECRLENASSPRSR